MQPIAQSFLFNAAALLGACVVTASVTALLAARKGRDGFLFPLLMVLVLPAKAARPAAGRRPKARHAH